MQFNRRQIGAGSVLALAATLAGCSRASGGGPRESELYRIDDEAKIIEAARAIIADDSIAALITVDADGAPRARSVGVSSPEADLTIWIGTRRGSRKTDQIRSNPRAALYFNNDTVDGGYYASLMGTATAHSDEGTIDAKNFYRQEDLSGYWPKFPDDFELIRFKPRWLEVAGRGIKGDDRFWQPQAVVLPSG